MKQYLILVAFGVVAAFAHYENHEPAHYKFDYGVHDLHTHDVKSQWERRDGHHVKGAYTLKEADGTLRVVEYTAGPHSGFNAVVKRVGHAHHPGHYGYYKADHGGDSYVGPTHWGFQH